MKKILIVAIVLLPAVAFAQQDTTTTVAPVDTLSVSWDRPIVPAFGWTISFYRNDKVIRPRYRKEFFDKGPESLEYFKKYKSNQTFFLVGGGVSLFLLLDVPNIGRTRAATLIPALGSFIVTYFFYRGANRNAEKAVSKWNEAMGY